MRLGDKTFIVDLNSTMSEDNIYDAMHSQLSHDFNSMQFIVWDAKYNKKARLHYHELEEGREYHITTCTARAHGPGTASKGMEKNLTNLGIILGHWNLTDTSAILPPSIAPRVPNILAVSLSTTDSDSALEDPTRWPRRLIEELRKLSNQTQGRHPEAMQFLLAAVQARYSRDQDPVPQVTSGDIRFAVQKRVQALGSVADRALGELPEEKAMTEIFAGGLSEGLEQAVSETVVVEVVPTYEMATSLVDWESLQRGH